MKKFLNLIIVCILSSISTLSSIGCGNNKFYFDDRTVIQFQDADFILNNKLVLNPNKHVLLIGFDGVPYENLEQKMIDASKFRANYYIQGYETVKGWTSVLWGNILQKEKTIFNLIKENNNNLKTANINQWMGSYYYSKVYGSKTIDYLDEHIDFADESDISNYDTIEKLQAQIKKLKNLTLEKVNDNSNFIFSYNTYYDELKHQHYFDNHPLINALIASYTEFVTSFFNSLDQEKWLVIVTTDHGRDVSNNNFNHPDVLTSHFSWTLANQDLSEILVHDYNNLYDIRTVALKWLMQ